MKRTNSLLCFLINGWLFAWHCFSMKCCCTVFVLACFCFLICCPFFRHTHNSTIQYHIPMSMCIECHFPFDSSHNIKCIYDWISLFVSLCINIYRLFPTFTLCVYIYYLLSVSSLQFILSLQFLHHLCHFIEKFQSRRVRCVHEMAMFIWNYFVVLVVISLSVVIVIILCILYFAVALCLSYIFHVWNRQHAVVSVYFVAFVSWCLFIYFSYSFVAKRMCHANYGWGIMK